MVENVAEEKPRIAVTASEAFPGTGCVNPAKSDEEHARLRLNRYAWICRGC